jgi:VIT1/CCC1 family predicted Fe2+/Mn2+ transporter/rubrerythrin
MQSQSVEKYIQTLQKAWRRERSSRQLYQALAKREQNLARRSVLLQLAEAEAGHSTQWEANLKSLGAQIPPDRDTLFELVWRWVLVQSGTDNALKRIEEAENDDQVFYAGLARLAPGEAERQTIDRVIHDEHMHSRVTHQATTAAPAPLDPQGMLDTILRREHWHRRGGGWIGQAVYGANDGLGSVFGIVSGVAGATTGGPAVLIAGLAGMLASALSMGSGAYLATKAEREVNESEIARERQELAQKPEEEQQELALFYQLKGVPEPEARQLAAHLVAQPETALKALVSEELGLSEQTFPNPWLAAISAALSTAFGAFIPIVPFFFATGYPAVALSFIISTVAHFLIGSAKTVVTGLSPWRSGLEMMIVGLGEALVTYGIGLLFGPLLK